MHCDYKDITSVMGVPKWYDVKGFPRYCNFHPDEVSNIYADVVIYYLIGCQGCSQKFNVAENYCTYNIWTTKGFKDYMEANKIGSKVPLTPHIVPYFKSIPQKDWGFLHYGDPPRHDCVGDTMNCWDYQILQFWVKDTEKWKWKRIKKLEFNLPDMATS